jgi:dipeptidyl aminopeptidase/acylaminoacyl peptidase
VTGVDTEGEGILKTISPALHAESADAPILLIHGKDDTRVPIEQSEFMASALKHAGKPCEFVELPHEDHFLSREATRIAMLKASVAFVEKYNPP